MIQARVEVPHFCHGITHYPVGSIIELPAPVVDRLVKARKLTYVTSQKTGYNRQDMQAEARPGPGAETAQTEEESPAVEAETLKPKRRGRPPGSRNKDRG